MTPLSNNTFHALFSNFGKEVLGKVESTGNDLPYGLILGDSLRTLFSMSYMRSEVFTVRKLYTMD